MLLLSSSLLYTAKGFNAVVVAAGVAAGVVLGVDAVVVAVVAVVVSLFLVSARRFDVGA